MAFLFQVNSAMRQGSKAPAKSTSNSFESIADALTKALNPAIKDANAYIPKSKAEQTLPYATGAAISTVNKQAGAEKGMAAQLSPDMFKAAVAARKDTAFSGAPQQSLKNSEASLLSSYSISIYKADLEGGMVGYPKPKADILISDASMARDVSYRISSSGASVVLQLSYTMPKDGKDERKNYSISIDRKTGGVTVESGAMRVTGAEVSLPYRSIQQQKTLRVSAMSYAL